MDRAELQPLMSHSICSGSGTSPLIEVTTMAEGGGEGVSVEQSYRSMESESLRQRSSPPSSPADDFIQIEDNGPVAEALKECEKWVLFPYRTVLRILGWTQFSRDGDSCGVGLIRVCLVVGWSTVIITTFLTQLLCCFSRDRLKPGRLENVTVNGSVVDFQRVVVCKEHVISSFLPGDLLLIFTYWFGLYLFSRGETEYLSNLAEKVFIKQAAEQAAIEKNSKGTRKMTKRNRIMIATILTFFVLGLLWIFLSFAVRVMTARSVRLFESHTIVQWSDDFSVRDGGKLVLIILSLIGFFTFDMVYVTAVMNYAAQSEMLINLLHSVRGLVEQKTYMDMDGAIKDIMEVRNYLRVLNGKTSAATALILYNLASAGIGAIITLDEVSQINVRFGDYFDETLATVTAGFNVLLWCSLVCFPFVQAARVTDACDKLRETGSLIRTRPFQYSKTPQLELDSYIAFTQAVKLRATIFGIPIHPWLVYVVLVSFTFTMLVLFQTGTYSFSYYL